MCCNFFLFFCRFAMLYIDVCTVFCKKKKTCGHACMIYNILLLITAPARRAGHTLQCIDRSPDPGRSAPTTPSTASTPPRPASRRRRQHAGPPHVVIVSTPATAPIRIYTSFVFICMYIYIAEHRRPRSPMRFYLYGGAPPPSFTHVYKHIYGGVEHRHSCHTALSRALIRPSMYRRSSSYCGELRP